MKQWFAFRAYNTQTQYGYGTQKQADAYTERLNANREINVYDAYPVSAAEAHELQLDKGYGDSFNLDDCELD